MNDIMKKNIDALNKLKPFIEERNQARDEYHLLQRRLKSKRPELQSSFSMWLYNIHKPLFLIVLSLITLWMLNQIIFPFLNKSLDFFGNLLDPSIDIKNVILILGAIFILTPVIISFKTLQETLIINKKDLHDNLSINILFIFLIVIIYILMIIVDIVGINIDPLIQMIYPLSTDLLVSINLTMKYALTYGILYLLLYYVLAYPYIYVLMIYAYINPLFLFPFLYSKLNKSNLKEKISKAKETYFEKQTELLQSKLLEENDYELDVINAIIIYFEEMRIIDPKHGAAIYHYEQELSQYQEAYISELRRSVNRKLSELDSLVKSEQRELDNDMKQRLRGYAYRQKKLDELDSSLYDLKLKKNEYEQALFDYRRSK